MNAQNRFWRILLKVARLIVDRGGHQPGVGPHQGDAGGFHRDIGAGAHGDTDVGDGQRRRIVDAVTDHADDPTRTVQCLDGLGLALGLHAAARFIHTGLLADRSCDRFGIA